MVAARVDGNSPIAKGSWQYLPEVIAREPRKRRGWSVRLGGQSAVRASDNADNARHAEATMVVVGVDGLTELNSGDSRNAIKTMFLDKSCKSGGDLSRLHVPEWHQERLTWQGQRDCRNRMFAFELCSNGRKHHERATRSVLRFLRSVRTRSRLRAVRA